MAVAPQLRWSNPDWLAEAHAWIAARLAEREIAASGPIEQTHVRPWSTVLRIPTRGGSVWFKASMPALVHEPAVVQLLARRRPERVPEVLAADLGRGWMLQANGGRRLRDVLEERPDPRRWEDVLASYAELQIDMARDAEELIAAGAPDRRLALLPGLYAALVADEEALRPATAEALTGEEVRRVRELVPRVAALCDELAAYGLPETIQHDDFHDGNVFVRDGGYLFFDWGDACVSHPIFTLHVTLNVLAHQLKLRELASELDRFRDVYLEPWTRFAPREELLTVFPAAYRLGGLCRALTWHLVVRNVPPPFDRDYADAVPDRLRMFLASGS